MCGNNSPPSSLSSCYSNGTRIRTLARMARRACITTATTTSNNCVPCLRQDQRITRMVRLWQWHLLIFTTGSWGMATTIRPTSSASPRTISLCPLRDIQSRCRRCTAAVAVWMAMDWVTKIRIWFRTAATGTAASPRTVGTVERRMWAAAVVAGTAVTRTVWVGWYPGDGGICQRCNAHWPGEWNFTTKKSMIELFFYQWRVFGILK